MQSDLISAVYGTDKMTKGTVAADERVKRYRRLLLAQTYGTETVYVIGHKNPDSDAVGSAIAYAYLLSSIGIPARAAISGPINNETAFALKTFGIETPEIVDKAGSRRFILVDHSAYAQAIDGLDQARIVGILDHHGIGDVIAGEFINVRSAPVGATASLVFLEFQECGVEIPGDMARVLLMSILSDTRNMKRNVTDVDRWAYDSLKGISDMGDLDAFYMKMAAAIASYGELSPMEILMSDYKAYDEAGTHFGIADVNAFGEDAVREIADRMYTVMAENYDTLGQNMLFTIINNKGDNEDENMMYMIAYGEDAKETLIRAFDNFDGKRYFIFRENLSRKKAVVPAILSVLRQ